MKIKIIFLVTFGFVLMGTSCQTNTPDNLSASLTTATGFAGNSEGEDFELKRQSLNNIEWFATMYKMYEPDKATISQLKKNSTHLSFIAFGGSWCSDTKKALPKFFKVVEQAKIPAEKIKLYGVDHEKHSLDKPVNGKTKSEEYGINRVPEFILFYDGKEIGRLNEKPTKSLEEDMLNLIQQRN